MPADHIFSYAQSLRGGGVERVLLRLAGQWIAAGRRVTIVIGDPSGPLAAEIPDGVEVIALGSARYGALLTLPRIVAERQPDVLFCPGSHYTSIAAWVRLRLGREAPPIVGQISNAIERADRGIAYRAGYRAWLRCHPHFLDRIVAISESSGHEVRAAMPGAPAKVVVIPNPPAMPVPGAVLPPLPPRFILGVGRLVPQKRWDRMIDALPRLRDTNIPLVILGEGELRAALMAQAAAAGVAGRLVMPGHVADPLGAMARAAVLVLTSDFEGVPGVLREALSVGTPVVATDSAPGVAETVATPALGSVVPRDDPAALVAALDHWLGDAPRPAPVPPPGIDAADRYLALFDSLMPA